MKTVLDFGALGDGRQDDTMAIQAAIDGLSGTAAVVVPAGTFSVGSLVLRSGTTLKLEAGAILFGRPDLGLYPGYPPVCDSRLKTDP